MDWSSQAPISQVCGPNMSSFSVIQFRGQDPPDQSDNDNYFKALKEAGVGEVLQVPVLVFRFLNLDILQEQLLHDNSFSGLILTSPRAVEAVIKCFENEETQFKRFQEIWSSRDIFCVGLKTGYETVSKLGLKPTLPTETLGDGKKLGQAIVSYLNSKNSSKLSKLLLPCSTIAKMFSVDLIREAGHEVVINFVYETTPHPDASKRLRESVSKCLNPIIVLVVFSPSGLSAIKEALEDILKTREVRIVAIGPTTEKALLESEIKGRKLLKTWLNRTMRVEMTDGRVLIGVFVCTDRERNLILGNASEYIKSSCGDGSCNEEGRILGLAMIPGKHIVSVKVEAVSPEEKEIKGLL